MCRIAAFLLLLFVSSAGALAQSPTPQSPQGRKSIGVISAIGDTFAVQKIGLMVFGNELKKAAIDAWAIDDRVADKINVLLSKRYDVRKVSYAKGAFAAFYGSSTNPFGNAEEELRATVRKIASEQKCDLYLVVTKAGSTFGDSNQIVSGLGILESSGLFGSIDLFALSAMTVYDGRTFAVLREKRTSIGQSTFMATIKGPHRELNQSWWPTQVAQNERLRNATWALVEQSIAMTLPELIQPD
jgi:hypothetical protein